MLLNLIYNHKSSVVFSVSTIFVNFIEYLKPSANGTLKFKMSKKTDNISIKSECSSEYQQQMIGYQQQMIMLGQHVKLSIFVSFQQIWSAFDSCYDNTFNFLKYIQFIYMLLFKSKIVGRFKNFFISEGVAG